MHAGYFYVLNVYPILSYRIPVITMYLQSGKQCGSWSAEKPADLDPHCFQNRIIRFQHSAFVEVECLKS